MKRTANTAGLALAALVMLLALAWMTEEASSHSYLPEQVDTNFRPSHIPDKTEVTIKWRVGTPPPNSPRSVPPWVRQVHVNFCVAKDVLPAGWDTQDNLKLRTDSMCAKPPQWSGWGKEISITSDHRSMGAGQHVFHTAISENHRRFIVSVNFVSGVVGNHHNSNNHTVLKLVLR